MLPACALALVAAAALAFRLPLTPFEAENAVRLLGFALASYPRVLPQVTRMTTGRAPADPEFAAAWEAFLREVGARLGPVSGRPSQPASGPTW